MKNIHQNVIKYLTCLVLNKRKLNNKQMLVPPPYWIGITSIILEPTSHGGKTPYVASWSIVISIRWSAHTHAGTEVVRALFFSFLFFLSTQERYFVKPGVQTSVESVKAQVLERNHKGSQVCWRLKMTCSMSDTGLFENHPFLVGHTRMGGASSSCIV